MAVGEVRIFCDGSCLSNPGGPGGWAAILTIDRGDPGDGTELVTARTFTGRSGRTTNNRAELRAAIVGLQALKWPSKVKIYTDSKYVYNGITLWIDAWKANNWKNSRKKPVANSELWLILDELCQGHNVEWFHVLAHQTGPDLSDEAEWNNRADEIAKQEALAAQRELEAKHDAAIAG